ncbi:hypothetical protein CLV98_101590 [Dyadobacter jejuensis]|uniref:Uncharacterized protein n=1 Tax=Dyadobacter jejuensis TaxID=1082580 RepID=A0A316ASU4_9BACT|nr:hypothetical protein CLV98_101590 [Dyadobacter jejuensis]
MNTYGRQCAGILTYPKRTARIGNFAIGSVLWYPASSNKIRKFSKLISTILRALQTKKSRNSGILRARRQSFYHFQVSPILLNIKA